MIQLALRVAGDDVGREAPVVGQAEWKAANQNVPSGERGRGGPGTKAACIIPA